jgi:hypothetical protein
MPDVTNQQVEASFTDAGLKYTRVVGREGLWELGFMMRTTAFTIQVDNGVGNPRFLSVNLMYMNPIANRQLLFQELLKKTGNVLFAKFGLADGNVVVRGCVPRDVQFQPTEKLKSVIGAVLQAADQWYVELFALASSPEAGQEKP